MLERVSAVQDGGLQLGIGVDLGLGESFGDPLFAGEQDGLVAVMGRVGIGGFGVGEDGAGDRAMWR